MTAKVDRDRLSSSFGDRGGRSAPRTAGLTAAVEKHHGRCTPITEPIGDDADAVNAVDGEWFRGRGHHQLPPTSDTD